MEGRKWGNGLGWEECLIDKLEDLSMGPKSPDKARLWPLYSQHSYRMEDKERSWKASSWETQQQSTRDTAAKRVADVDQNPACALTSLSASLYMHAYIHIR